MNTKKSTQQSKNTIESIKESKKIEITSSHTIKQEGKPEDFISSFDVNDNSDQQVSILAISQLNEPKPTQTRGHKNSHTYLEKKELKIGN